MSQYSCLYWYLHVFILLGRTRFNRHDGEQLACYCSWCWFGWSEVHFRKDRAAHERAACLSIKNLVSESLLCWDGFKLVFELNKVVISTYGQFISKEYDSGGLFYFSLFDVCNKVMNHMCDSNNSVADILHSHLCHINFGCMSRLSSMSLTPNFSIVKRFKCQACVQA
jgi:hypothetical protein